MRSPQYVEGRKRRTLTDAEELQLVAQYEDCSLFTLSNAWGIARSTVGRILSDHKVVMRPRGRPNLNPTERTP